MKKLSRSRQLWVDLWALVWNVGCGLGINLSKVAPWIQSQRSNIPAKDLEGTFMVKQQQPWIRWNSYHQALQVRADAPKIFMKFALGVSLAQSVVLMFMYWLDGGSLKDIDSFGSEVTRIPKEEREL